MERLFRNKPYSILTPVGLSWVILAVVFLLRASVGYAVIIPANRVAPWTPGIPGGVPVITNIFADATQAPYNADKTGASDASAAIQQAINACPSGRVVYLPAGTYMLNSQLTIGKGIVLRGAGPDKTFLKTYANWHGIQIGNWPAAPVSTSVSGSPAKGSTSLTIASISSPSIGVGSYIVIDQIDDGVEVINAPSGSETSPDSSRNNNTRSLSQITKVTSVSGTGPYTIGIDPPLYHAYSSAQTPEVWVLNQGIAMTTYAGVESLCLDRVSPISQSGYDNFKLVACAYCWIKNVESRHTTWWHVDLDRTFRCEIRDSFFNDGYFQGTGGCSYGVTCDNRSTGHLIENNIFYHLRHSMVVKGGATGCVFGYNYSFNSYQTAGFLAPDMFIHGCHANMNLFEGNYGTKMDGDNLHGSGAYNTYFRNYASRVSTSETITSGRWPAVMDVELNYQNFVGNILGQSNLTWTAEESGSTRVGSGTYEWSFGFQSDGGTTQVSTQAGSTTLRHGNYEDINHQVIWDPSISDHTIPASLYLTSKPQFFGSYAWPAIGSDLQPMVGMIPAMARYLGLSAPQPPPPPTGLRIVAHVP